VNAFAEWQIKINDMLYIPIFATTAGGRIDGTPDDGSLLLDNISSFDNSFIDENINRYLFGSGLFIMGKTIKGGIYAGYCLEHFEINNRGSILDRLGRRQTHSYEDDVWKHSLKIALLPALDTSNWKCVGKALNTVLGYIGLGDAVEIYAGEEEERTAAALINALNYGLDFAFKKLEFNPLSLNARLFYRRDNYDAIARSNTYGAALDGSFLKLPFGIKSEFGFRHFYSVSKYFQSKYSNTWFFNIGISFSNFLNWFDNILLMYKYDAISEHSVAISTTLSYLGAFIIEIGFGENTYNKGIYDMKEKSFTIGLGFRYIWDIVF
jgi:hypothetical protein